MEDEIWREGCGKGNVDCGGKEGEVEADVVDVGG